MTSFDASPEPSFSSAGTAVWRVPRAGYVRGPVRRESSNRIDAKLGRRSTPSLPAMHEVRTFRASDVPERLYSKVGLPDLVLQSRKAPMSIADDILDLLRRKRRLKLTAMDIAEMLYWEDRTYYERRVRADCLDLYNQGKLLREGKGSLADPHTYSIAPLERRWS